MNKKFEIYIYPTDTLWGIGTSIFDELAHKQVATIKGTSDRKPLSVMLASIESVNEFVNYEKYLEFEKMKELFNNQVTLAFPKADFKKDIPSYIAPESTSIGLRVATQKEVSDLIKNAGGAITTTSLNKTGEPPITDQKLALKFYHSLLDSYSNIYFQTMEHDDVLSGEGSTFVLIKPTGDIEILREGSQVDQVRKILGV